jgi:hypothetical protein
VSAPAIQSSSCTHLYVEPAPRLSHRPTAGLQPSLAEVMFLVAKTWRVDMFPIRQLPVRRSYSARLDRDNRLECIDPTGAEPPTAIRRITFWREGFSVDHDPSSSGDEPITGELRRYDDPANAQILREINEG